MRQKSSHPSESAGLFGESKAEELANTITHGIGAILSLFALIWMVNAALPRSVWHITGVSVFGICLVLLYLSSAIYHYVTSIRLKRVFRVADHCFIYVLIAGSYTPWLIVNLRGPVGWTIFALVCALAAVGVFLKMVFLPRFESLGLAIYLVMGWLICIAPGPLVTNVNTAGLLWLLAGGLCYTVGVIFFRMKNLRFSHAIWHGFVLKGSACHVIAVLVAVIPHQV